MTELCGKSFEENQEDYNLIWEQKTIAKMLKKQDENGMWNNKDYGGFTGLRYLTAFAEHGLRKDKRLDNYVDAAVNVLQSCEKNGGLAGCDYPLTLRALVMLGYHDRSDILDLLNKFAEAQLYDGGFMCKMKLDKNPKRKSCYKAAIAGLLLYAECKRKNILPDNAGNLINYFLKRDIFYSSDKIKKFDEGKFGWRFVDNFFPVEPMRMGLPLIIFALSVLGAGNNPAMKEAWDMLKDKKDEKGRLHLDGTLTKQPCSFGKLGQENKWLTLYAVLAEKYRTQ